MMIKTLISSIFKILLLASFGVAQANAQTTTAGILPLAKTQFLDENGKPLSSGKVYFYNPGTTTAKTTWQDINKSVANANPVVLDAGGRALIWGDGTYRQQVYDRSNNLKWDQVTSGTGTGSTTSSGDGNSVGTVLSWSGFIAPPQYMFAYGQSVSRSTYSSLLSALTQRSTITCAGGNSILNGFTDTTQIPIGAAVEASCLLTTGIVTAKTSTTITLNITANVSLATVATVYPYGNGDASTTFNLPDYRGQALIGRNNMGGVQYSGLTSPYYLSDPNALGASGGSQTHTLTVAELPPVTSSGNNSITVSPTGGGNGVPVTSTPGNVVAVTITAGAGASVPSSTAASWAGTSTFTGTNSIQVTSTGTLSSPHSVVQPSKTINYIIKVLPDVSISGLFGVSDIAGMQGSIACGAGLVCAGNTINTVPGSTTGIIGFFAGNGISLSGTCSTNLTGSCTISTIGADSTQTLPYTITNVNTACGSTVNFANGPGTLTLSGSGSFAVSCSIEVCNNAANSAASHAITLSNFPAPSLAHLWPGQCEKVKVIPSGSAWQVTEYPGAFTPRFGLSCYADSGGNNNNDGLVSNAATSAVIDPQQCINIWRNEISVSAIGQPTVCLTGGQTYPQATLGPLTLASFPIIINVATCSGGSPAVLRSTASNVVTEQSDFGGYLIFGNLGTSGVTLDCTSAGSHPCYTVYNHQQGGWDFFTTAGSVTLIGANALDYGIYCDSICKVNGGTVAGLSFQGSFADMIHGELGSMMDFNGINLNSSASAAGSIIRMAQNSTATLSGTLVSAGSGVTSVAQILSATNNATVLLGSNFNSSGSIGGSPRQFAALNGGIVCNGSGVAIPGSAGITALAGWTAGAAVAVSGICLP
jgi:microcystin-dependent protein